MLTVESYLAVILDQADALATDADATGPDAVVPTCPRWKMADLIGHLGVVHRWAAGNIGGPVRQQSDLEEQARASRPDDPAARPAWLRDGAEALVAHLAGLPDDAKGMRFLTDAPAPRLFWARRQSHETTIHRVDGLAARLGRTPTAAESAVPLSLALDGIDELVTGFLPRSHSKLRSPEPVRIGLRPDDSDQVWTIVASSEPPVVTRSADPADVVFHGSAAALYLGLWNRGDEITVAGDRAVLELWHRVQRVTWN